MMPIFTAELDKPGLDLPGREREAKPLKPEMVEAKD
jgi:hypothetical protein